MLYKLTSDMKWFWVSLFLLPLCSPAKAQNRDALLNELDKAVADKDYYINRRQKEIDRLTENLSVASTVTDRYLTCKQLAKAYTKFNSDSALTYLHRCYDLGVRTGNKAWTQDALVQYAFVFADRGDQMYSRQKLAALGSIDSVLPSLRSQYAKAALMYFITQRKMNQQVISGQAEQQAYKQYHAFLDPKDVYTLLFRMRNAKPHEVPALIKAYEQRLTATQRYTYDEAMICMLLATLYTQTGDKEKNLDMIIRSAIADIHCANRSSSSMVYLITRLNDDNYNIDKLTAYFNLSMENVAAYRDVGRSMDLLKVQRRIREQYTRHLQRRIITTGTMAGLFIVALALLAFMLWKRLKRTRWLLAQQQNESLHVPSLQAKINEQEIKIKQLQGDCKALQSRLQYIFGIPALMFAFSGYIITDVRKFKKRMANLLQANSHIEARRLANGSVIQDMSIEQLYHRFDEVFLTLYPDFVERFNALLKPEARLIPEEKGSLTPELRIYALIVLGVTDSVSIAEILQYSPQTVYNYRLKVRHTTLTPKFELARYVAKMYKDNPSSDISDGET